MSLPNFMCLGATKSGTTTLYDILRQHSDIYIPSFKEPHFFDIPDNFKNGLEWYKETYYRNAESKIIADFTPTYFFDQYAPKRIFQSLGKDIKFLVLLRNPVDRAYSHYLHSIRDFHETETFNKSIKLESNRLMRYINQKDYLSYLRHSYIQQSLYSRMLDRYLKYFSLDNFMFVSFEDEFLKERELTVKKILNFLELDSSVVLRTDIRSNPSSIAKSKYLKKLIKRGGWWRDLFKSLIPSLKIRQIIKNRIQRANISEFNPPQFSKQERIRIFNLYFKNDVTRLQTSLNMEFSSWIPDDKS